MTVRLPAGSSLLLAVISNPQWIALTTPGRWVSDQADVLAGRAEKVGFGYRRLGVPVFRW